MIKFICYILMVIMLILCFALNSFTSSQDISTTGDIEKFQLNGEIASKERTPLTPEYNSTLIDNYYKDKQLVTITPKFDNDESTPKSWTKMRFQKSCQLP